nr:hypothetical protein [uncultured bacterium]
MLPLSSSRTDRRSAFFNLRGRGSGNRNANPRLRSPELATRLHQSASLQIPGALRSAPCSTRRRPSNLPSGTRGADAPHPDTFRTPRGAVEGKGGLPGPEPRAGAVAVSMARTSPLPETSSVAEPLQGQGSDTERYSLSQHGPMVPSRMSCVNDRRYPQFASQIGSPICPSGRPGAVIDSSPSPWRRTFFSIKGARQ